LGIKLDLISVERFESVVEPGKFVVLSFWSDEAAVDARDDSSLDELLHAANAFGQPSEVVNGPDLCINEKRAILASWASHLQTACFYYNGRYNTTICAA
jgi:hypothetical protein